jgi:subtilisin family serine protease
MGRDVRALVFVIAAGAALLASAAAWASPAPRTEVVVTLSAPSLARAVQTSRVLSSATKERRLDLGSPTSRGYVAELQQAQRRLERRIRAAIPAAKIRWRYTVVLNGLAVTLPGAALPDLARVPGVERVYPGGSYRASLDRGPGLIGADELWGAPGFTTAGNGIKIGVIDDGVDQTHPFFNPAGYTYPPGFPKGQRSFTTPKVIVARAFAPVTTTWKYARLPFDPEESEHGTHVAGIAAGNYTPAPVEGRGALSGVAPRAYIGNYKVLSTPSDFGLIDNAGEVIAGIEAAVRDGMDVINMSFGEFETDPARNVVDDAVNGAADAGVVPVAAAGNSYQDLGRGSIGSPATAARAISVAAVTKSNVIASFSSSGPTAMSLRLKPEVSAPGVAILSSVPSRAGTWASFSGTSMASPHVAGAVALLRQRNPDWTVAEIASALVATGRRVVADTDDEQEALATREGGGLVDLPEATQPLVFATPPVVSFGLLQVGRMSRVVVDLADAGSGAGTWAASTRLQSPASGVKVTVPTAVTVPGGLEIDVTAADTAAEADLTGFVLLQRGAKVRRIPFWLRTEDPALGPPARTLTKQGTYGGDARRGRRLVSSYRYPDDPAGVGVTNLLPGPEQVFRVRIRKEVANLGARVVKRQSGVRVTPRIVFAGNENRLTGVPALPIDVNPYRDSYGDERLVSAAIRPSVGAYDVVFDTVSRSAAGRFSFRVWINDKAPPRIRLLTPVTTTAADVMLAVADGGSGVDPQSIRARVDGANVPFTLSAGRIKVLLERGLGRGRHRLAVTVADYQETKNSESVVGILPNTTVLRTTFRVR